MSRHDHTWGLSDKACSDPKKERYPDGVRLAVLYSTVCTFLPSPPSSTNPGQQAAQCGRVMDAAALPEDTVQSFFSFFLLH